MRAGKLFTMIGFATFSALLFAPAVEADRNDILIVPARTRMVRLAFDVQAFRGPTVISYQETDNPLQPLMHVWNRSNRTWQQMDISAFTRTRHVPSAPQRVYVIGLPNEIPEVIPAAVSHARNLRMVQTLSAADILTVLDQDMAFNLNEWRALAERHNLTITELNPEQRRWGRFGPPRRYREQAPPWPDSDMPEVVAPLFETIDTPTRPHAVPEVRPPIVPSSPQPEPIVQEREPTLAPEPAGKQDEEQAKAFEYPKPYDVRETVDPVPPEEPVAAPAVPEPDPVKGVATPPRVLPEPVQQEEDFPIK